MYGRNLENLVMTIDRITTTIPDASDISCIPKVQMVSKNYDAAMQKISVIDKNIYVRNNLMHNSIGSPYTELNRLKATLHAVINLGKDGVTEENETKVRFMLSKIHWQAIDAKWATLMYGDFLERGYNYIQGESEATSR